MERVGAGMLGSVGEEELRDEALVLGVCGAPRGVAAVERLDGPGDDYFPKSSADMGSLTEAPGATTLCSRKASSPRRAPCRAWGWTRLGKFSSPGKKNRRQPPKR